MLLDGLTKIAILAAGGDPQLPLRSRMTRVALDENLEVRNAIAYRTAKRDVHQPRACYAPLRERVGLQPEELRGFLRRKQFIILWRHGDRSSGIRWRQR